MFDAILAHISPRVFLVNLFVFDDQPEPHILNVLQTPALESTSSHFFYAHAPFLFLCFFFGTLYHLLLQLLLNRYMCIRCRSTPLCRIFLSLYSSSFWSNLFFLLCVNWYTRGARHSSLELNQATVRREWLTTPQDCLPLFLDHFNIVKLLVICFCSTMISYLASGPFSINFFHHLDTDNFYY